MTDGGNDDSDRSQDLEEQAQQKRVGLVREFLAFLGQNKKWWLLPILVVMLLFGVLVFLTTTGAAPFMYTLF